MVFSLVATSPALAALPEAICLLRASSHSPLRSTLRALLRRWVECQFESGGPWQPGRRCDSGGSSLRSHRAPASIASPVPQPEPWPVVRHELTPTGIAGDRPRDCLFLGGFRKAQNGGSVRRTDLSVTGNVIFIRVLPTGRVTASTSIPLRGSVGTDVTERLAALGPCFAGLTALTTAPRTLVQTGSRLTMPNPRPQDVGVDARFRLTPFLMTVDTDVTASASVLDCKSSPPPWRLFGSVFSRISRTRSARSSSGRHRHHSAALLPSAAPRRRFWWSAKPLH